MMKTIRNINLAVLFILIGTLIFMLPGCSGGGSDSGGGVSGGGGSSTSSSTVTYTCSGRITDLLSSTALSAASCTLSDSGKNEKYSYTTTTDSAGNFTFSGVPAGNYTLHVSASNYVSMNDNFTIYGDTTRNDALPNLNDWNTIMNDTTHPYDASSGYFAVNVYNQQTGGISGAAVSCNPTSYSARGYVATNGKINWSASSTTANGGAFFYKVTTGKSYTLSVSGGGTSYSPITATPISGEITMYNFTNAPTPSQSPTQMPRVVPTTCLN